MPHRVRRAAPLRAALVVAFALLTLAPAASAANPWPTGTQAITQAVEGSQIPDPSTQPVAQILGHGYGYTPVVAGDATTGALLKVRFHQGRIAVPGHAVTLLDFDRDGLPEVLVDAEMRIENQSSGRSTGVAHVFDIRSQSNLERCVTVPARATEKFSVVTQGTEPTNDLLVSEIPLQKLSEGASPLVPIGALRNPPRILTLATANATGNVPTDQVLDRLPAAATNNTNACAAGQLSYNFALATDRLPGGASPKSSVVHTDPKGDNGGGNADLTRVAVEQYQVNTPAKNDVLVDGDSASVRTIYPSDLVVDFASATSTASVTYVWDQTWNRTTVRESPNAVVRTESAGNGKVRVHVSRNITGRTAWHQQDIARCLATVPPASSDDRSFVVSLATTDNGDRRVSIPLDSLLKSEAGPTQGDAVAKWRFHTISDPGQVGAFAPIDHAPLFAGYSQDGQTGVAGCDTGSGPGAQVFLDRSFTVGVTPPKAELVPSTTTPARGAEVTWSLGQTTGNYVLCSFTRAFNPTSCYGVNATQTYQQDATARLSTDAADGAWESAEVDIKVQNNRPTAAISRVGTTPAQGTDGTFAIEQGAAVSVPLKVTGTDSDPGTAFTYRWTLDGGTTASTAETYTPSFSAPGSHTVRAWVIDDSGDDATKESLAAEFVIQVVRSPKGEVAINRPARVINGQPFDIDASTSEPLATYQALTWQWDLDGDAGVDFDPARTTRALTNVVIPTANPAYLVRVRATDAGGRVADATIQLNVRRANEAPALAKFTVSANPKSGSTTTFDGSSSQLSQVDGSLLPPVGQNPTGVRFRWSFGDGTPDVVTTTATTTHVYAGSGKPKASLIVEDARSTPVTLSDPVEKTIEVGPGATDANAPVARLTRQDPPATEPVFANRPVTVTAAASTAAAGHAPLSYAFDLDGNGTFEKTAQADPTVTFMPASAGPLTVSVKVTDTFASSTVATLPLDVKAEPIAPPTAVIAGPDQVNLTGVTVDAAYDATGSKGNNLDPAVTYRWDLDDNGSFETPTGTDPKATATFSESGARKVSVRVTDRYGNTAEATKTTIVRSAADLAAGCTGASSFREAEYANIRLRGCVVTVDRPSAGELFVITGKTIQFNGMRLAERAGSRPTPRPFADCNGSACKAAQDAFNAAGSPWGLVLDTSDGSLRSNGLSSLRATGSGIDLPLLGGALNVTLPSEPEDGFTLATPQAAELLGFPLAGSVSLTFPDPGESVITVNVGLPSVLGGFTGTAGIRTTAAGGVLLDELRIEVGEVALGKLTLGKLYFVYSRPEALWEGGASLTLPTPKPLTISAELAIQNNRFKRIWAEVSGLNQPIAQAIYLQAIRAGVAVDPLDLTAGVTLSAGPAVKNKAILSVDGDMRLRFPSPAANYYLFAITGKLKLADFQLASAFAQFTSNGFFEMGGSIDASFGIGYFNAGIKGWITKNAFNIDGDAEVGVDVRGSRVALFGGHVTLSTTGFGACGEVPVIDLGAGFGTRWGSGVDFFWGCDLSPYRATRPADAPATPLIVRGQKAVRTDVQRGRLLLAGPEGHLLNLPKKQEKALITMTGRTAPPRVAIVDKGGKVLLSTPADGTEVLTKGMLVKVDAEQKTTTVLWKAPPGGKAWVVAQRGSSQVTKVDLALPAPKRDFGITVGGKGRNRTLNWNITPALQEGETVQLAEEGAEAGTELVTTAKSSGSVPFTPQGGKYGKRNIVATMSADGLPGEAQTVATYVAPPPPAPARVASLDLKRSSSGVLVSWAPGAGGGAKAAKWRAIVRVAHSRRKQLLVVDGTRSSLRIPNINPSDAVSVELTGADASGVEGPVRKAVIKAGLRASSGPLSLSSTAVPRNIVVRRIGGNRLRVTWKTGPAFVRGWSIRVSGAKDGRRKGRVTLLRSAGDDHSVDFVGVPEGDLRVSVIGRRYQGTVTRKDVKYLG